MGRFRMFSLWGDMVLRRFARWKESVSLERASQKAEIVEAAAVTLALLVAAFEYFSHQTAEEAKKREAVSAILQRAFDPRGVDDAYGNLYRKYAQGCSGPRCEDEFDNDTGTLTSYFWAVESCVRGKLCDSSTVHDVYCDDFEKYYNKYCEVHHKEKTDERFKGWNTLLTCVEKRCPK
jgi:hypothetical protein